MRQLEVSSHKALACNSFLLPHRSHHRRSKFLEAGGKRDNILPLCTQCFPLAPAAMVSIWFFLKASQPRNRLVLSLDITWESPFGIHQCFSPLPKSSVSRALGECRFSSPSFPLFVLMSLKEVVIIIKNHLVLAKPPCLMDQLQFPPKLQEGLLSHCFPEDKGSFSFVRGRANSILVLGSRQRGLKCGPFFCQHWRVNTFKLFHPQAWRSL